MAATINNTLVKIGNTVTVGSGGASSIDFTSIPQTYTDLVVYVSARTSYSGIEDYIRFQFNGTTTNLSSRYLYGSGSGVGSASVSDNYSAIIGNTATANTFANSYFYLPNYTSSNYKSFSVDSVGETNGTTVYSTLLAGLWSSTSAVTSIKIVPFQSGNFQQYTTATLYGVTATPSTTKASGGIIYQDATYMYHVFPYSGTFTPSTSMSVDYLVVAGGGGGGTCGGNGGGGGAGGAGGLRNASSYSVTASSSYTVTVGGGGAYAASRSVYGTKGSNSVFDTITSTGGGGGAGTDWQNAVAQSGGSGGGGSGSGDTNYTYVTPGASASPSGQGYAGGNGYGGGGASGGGGGAGAVGANATSLNGGNGGVGSSSLSSWAIATSTGQIVSGTGYYAGGGGGAAFYTSGTKGSGGYGGGGDGGQQSTLATSGSTNTGGGGGGASYGPGNQTGGSGGSGIVIIRYAK